MPLPPNPLHLLSQLCSSGPQAFSGGADRPPLDKGAYYLSWLQRPFSFQQLFYATS